MAVHLANSYESEAGTVLLATNCLICGRPLRDPESLERGVGPYCAKKHGIFTSTGPLDETALGDALDTAPPDMAASVRQKLPDGRAALSMAIHAAGRAWETRDSAAAHYIGAAMEIATALGYRNTADTLRNIFIGGTEYDEEGNVKRRGKPRGIVVEDPGSGSGEWEIRLPFIEGPTWRSTKAAMKAAGVRTFKARDGSWHDVFKPGEREWLLVLNSLVDTLAGTLGVLPSGETFIVPRSPVSVPAPEGPAAGAPNREDLPPPPPPPEVAQGDRIELHDGRVMVAARVGVNSKGPWVGLMTEKDAATSLARYGYLKFKQYSAGFCGLAEVKQKLSSASEQRAVEEETGTQLGAEVKRREIPADLQPWQKEGVLWLDEKQSGTLAFEQGVGKTPTALAALDAPALIIVPASLRENWRREANRWRPDLVVSKIEKASDATPEALAGTCVIVGYEALSSDTVFTGVMARKFRTMVVDEAQKLKELRVKHGQHGFFATRNSPKVAQNVYRLAQVIPRKIFLTGTPMVNGRPYELWPLLHMSDPAAWDDQEAFWWQYCDPREVRVPARTIVDDDGREVHLPSGTTLNVNGHSNLAELRDRVNGHYLFRRTKAVLSLPEKRREYRSVGLSPEAGRQYRAAAEDFLAWVTRQGGPKAALRAARAEVISRLSALRRITAIGKAPTVIEAAHAFLGDTGRPLIIMGHHEEALTAIETALDHLGYRVGSITGQVTGRRREKMIDEFQTGLPANKPIERRKFLDVLVCSITAAGVGLTLTRAQDMFMAERVWRPFDLVQAEDRIHRYGQKNECVITYFDAAGTIDDKLSSLLAEKEKTAAEVIDGVDLDEEDAQEQILSDMFAGLTEHMVANSGEAVSATPLFDWIDPEVS